MTDMYRIGQTYQTHTRHQDISTDRQADTRTSEQARGEPDTPRDTCPMPDWDTVTSIRL